MPQTGSETPYVVSYNGLGRTLSLALKNATPLLCSMVLLSSQVLSLAGEVVTVRPKEIDDVLVNPGIGFTTFQRFNGDALNEGLKWTEGFPIEYQPFSGSLTNRDHPMTSIAYFRVYWKFLEPELGVYRWEMLDKALAVARERGQSLMLRVAPYGTGADNDVPGWYRAWSRDRSSRRSCPREMARASGEPFVCAAFRRSDSRPRGAL